MTNRQRQLHGARRVAGIAVLAVVALALSSCGGASDRDRGPTDSLHVAADSEPEVADVRGIDPRDAMELANEWKGNSVTSYVTTEAVEFEFANGRAARVELPDDELVVAIAPYVEETHPCETHYMSGCQGEMVGVEVAVRAETLDGTIILDETMRTMMNGFIELWLPRDREVVLTLAADGRSVRETIGTYAGSRTCITTMRLM